MTDTSAELVLVGDNFGPRAADITVQIAGQNCTGIFLRTAHVAISCNSPRVPYEGQVALVVTVNGQRTDLVIGVSLPQLPSSLRTIVFTVTVIAIFLMVLLFVAVFRLRTARVFKASSPPFLLIFIMGSCMQVCHNDLHNSL